MPFTQTYTVKADYLTTGTQRRSGLALLPARFIVAHDTGNPNSTALGNVSYYKNSVNVSQQSAHIFVDDKDIIECIPAVTGVPEKAWHVRYDVVGDNTRYGDDANDVAIGVEYCYGPAINADEAYKRYVWTLAYICFTLNLPPTGAIVGHFELDPTRRTDPKTGLAASGRTFAQLLLDVAAEYALCTNPLSTLTQQPMKLIKNPSSNKVYAVGTDNKKHWIINEETFLIGKEAGLWGGDSTITVQPDDAYALGHTIVLVKP